MATPIGIAAAAAASRFGLRPTRLAASKDLHHFLGHQLPEAEPFSTTTPHGRLLVASSRKCTRLARMPLRSTPCCVMPLGWL